MYSYGLIELLKGEREGEGRGERERGGRKESLIEYIFCKAQYFLVLIIAQYFFPRVT